MTRDGRADLHIHSLASDGTAGVLDDHRPGRAARPASTSSRSPTTNGSTPAVAARAIARERGLGLEVVVGEEITTRGGHLLGLFLTERVLPLASLRTTIAAVHDQGGLAIPAHPLFPYPLCAQAASSAGCSRIPIPRVRPDALEAFNPTTLGRPWHAPGRRVRRRARACRRSATATPTTPARDRPGLHHVPGPHARRTCARRSSGRQTHWHGVVPPDRRPARRCSAGSFASTAATSATTSVAGSAATARAATSATRAAAPAAAFDGPARRESGEARAGASRAGR